MSITLGSNIASLQAQRQLFRTEQNLSTVFERLSSGQRINRASDDAAGLAISESLNTDRRVFNQAIRNLNDGFSVLNLADSTVAELSQIVTRMQELAEQSANGSLSNVQRSSLNREAQALKEEFFRVSRSTDFNGLRLFDGSLENGVRLQAGYGTDGSIFSSLGGKLGDGTFSLKDSFLNGPDLGNLGDTRDMKLVDVNRDGILDLVAAINDGDDGGESAVYHSYLSVRHGLGDGTFSEESTLSLHGEITEAIELADLNNDGILDLIATGRNNSDVGELRIHLGNGDGTFGGGEVSGAEPFNSHELQVKDLNNDGNLDIVTVGTTSFLGDGLALVRLGDGSGSFGSVATVATESRRTNDLDLSDVNGDGILDLLTGGYDDSGNGQVTLQFGNGDGTFRDGSQFSTGSEQVSDVFLRDLNGDGSVDIVSTEQDGSGGEAKVYLGDGVGGFGSALISDFGGVFSYEIDSALADINGDGILDGIGTEIASNVVQVTLGNGDGTFQSATSFADQNFAQGNSRITGFVLNDIDGDGVLDLLVGGGFEDSGAEFQSQISVFSGNTREGIAPILDFSLETQADALQALAPLSRKLELLAEQRGTIGAFQSRLESALNTLTAASENYAAAESRIRDTDVAFEAANLSRLNILQQAAASVLAQANQQPSLAITLLQ